MRRRSVLALLAGGVSSTAGCSTVPTDLIGGGGDGSQLLHDVGEPITRVVPSSDGGVYVQTESGIHALSGSGEFRWHYDRDSPVGPLAVSADTVYLGTDLTDRRGPTAIVAINDTTGKRLWRVKPDEVPMIPLAATESAVFGASFDDASGSSGEHAFALKAADGARRWVAESGDPHGSFLAGETLYVRVSGRIYAYDVATGDLTWQRAYDIVDIGFRRFNQTLVVADQGLHALSLSDGDTRWSFTAEGYDDITDLHINSVALATGARQVYAGDGDGFLWSVDADSGEPAWRFQTGTKGVWHVQTDGERAFVSTGDTVHSVDGTDPDPNWTFTPDGTEKGAPSPIFSVGESLFVFVGVDTESMDRVELNVLDPATGDQRWRTSFSTLDEITPFGDELLVATDGRIYRVSGSQRLTTPT